MSLQLITNDEKKSIMLTGSVVHSDDNTIITLINANMLTEEECALLEYQSGFIFSLSYDQCFKTSDHYIQTSPADGGSLVGLTEGQWLIKFDLKTQ